MWIVLLIVLVFLAGYVWLTYNQFVTIKARIRASIQEIGNQLKRQAELIPNLVESVKGYMKHEKTIFKELTEARKAVVAASSQDNVGKMVAASNQLQKAIGDLRVVVESTPEIKAAGTVTKLMDELRDTADKVMYSRRTLIDLVADYNIKIRVFPSNLVARLFGFESEKGFQTPEEGKHLKLEEEETKTPKVSL